MTGKTVTRLAVLFGTLCVLSCKPPEAKLYPVEGKILFNGAPAPQAHIFLHPLDDPTGRLPKPQGRAGPDGSFQISTNRLNDGAPPGRYTVTIIWVKGEPEEGPDELAGRFRDPKASPWTVQVKEGPNRLEPFEVKPR